MTMRGQITVSMDYVVICGVRVNRPAGIARSFWMAYWERKS